LGVGFWVTATAWTQHPALWGGPCAGASKRVRLIPVAGAVVGAGFNAWYLKELTHTAYMLSRERFLRQRYGSALPIT
jgi:hypothetical protein